MTKAVMPIRTPMMSNLAKPSGIAICHEEFLASNIPPKKQAEIIKIASPRASWM